MDKASLLALVASNIYVHGGELSVEDCVSLAGEIISTCEAEVRQTEIEATRVRRQALRPAVKPSVRPDIDSEDCPF